MSAMSIDRPPLSADELREQLRAETHLAKLELFEDLAVLHETATIDRERRCLAERYRACVGVPPDRRTEFRAVLERVLTGDGGSITQCLNSHVAG
jgi:folate-dependent tRNA-U54 methylase TrmFO/GidA